jgi:hypothetical protein
MNPRFFAAASNLSIVESTEWALGLVTSPSTANVVREVPQRNTAATEATT